MNQKGEVTLLSTLLVLVLMSVVLLSALELRKSFKLLEKRTELFICTKEAKGELNLYLKFMGRTNWGIKNIKKIALIMMFIPGLQGVAANAEKAKKYLQLVQELKHVSYLKTLGSLKAKGCALDPRMYISPFIIGPRFFKRDFHGALKLKETKWTYYYFSKPYLLSLEVNASSWESFHPKLNYIAGEKGAKLSSLLSSL
jgi:hypothetical protein